MIPTMINNEIPFPIPLSVILSPNHIAKIVPVVNVTQARNQKVAGSRVNTTPCALKLAR